MAIEINILTEVREISGLCASNQELTEIQGTNPSTWATIATNLSAALGVTVTAAEAEATGMALMIRVSEGADQVAQQCGA